MAGYLGDYNLTGNSDPINSYLQEIGSRGPDYSAKLGAGLPAMESQASKVAGMTGAAALPFMMTPAGAAVAVGSQFASQLLAQKAADERAKREQSVQIAQQHGAGEQRGFENLINVYRGMTRG